MIDIILKLLKMSVGDFGDYGGYWKPAGDSEDLEDLYDDYNMLSDREILTMCVKTDNPICRDQTYWAYRYDTYFGVYYKSRVNNWKKIYMQALIDEEEKIESRKNKTLLIINNMNVTLNRTDLYTILGKIVKKENLNIDIVSMRNFVHGYNSSKIEYQAMNRLASHYKDTKILILEDMYANKNYKNLVDIAIMLDKLSGIGELIPNINIINYLGSKTYAKDFRDMMLPTYIWPLDTIRSQLPQIETSLPQIKSPLPHIETSLPHIEKLPRSDYIIKRGYSSANMGNIVMKDKTGEDIINAINDMLIEFAIIQPLSDIFNRCDEYRLLMVDGKILDVYYGNVSYGIGSVKIYNHIFKLNTYKLALKNDVVMNDKVYKFLQKIYNRFVSVTGVNNSQLRIDFTIKCTDKPVGDYETNSLPDIFDPNWSGNIYLNEIDTIASGIWGKPRYRDRIYRDHPDLNQNVDECNVQIDDDGTRAKVDSNILYSDRVRTVCNSEYKLAKSILNQIVE